MGYYEDREMRGASPAVIAAMIIAILLMLGMGGAGVVFWQRSRALEMARRAELQAVLAQEERIRELAEQTRQQEDAAAQGILPAAVGSYEVFLEMATDGALRLGDKAVTLQQLAEMLQQAATSNQTAKVVLQVDAGCPFGLVSEVLSVCQQHQATLRFETRALGGAEEPAAADANQDHEGN